MPRITLDAAVIAQLANLLSPVEICDPDGKVIGIYRPKIDLAKYGPQISDEEIQRRLNEPGPRYTTEEVIERLRKLRPGSI